MNEALLVWASRALTAGATADPPPSMDRATVEALFEDQGIAPLLYEWLRLQAQGHNDDKTRRSHRDRMVADEMARKVEFIETYDRVTSALTRKPIIFKGQALAYSLYPKAWHRPRWDIDALVHESDFALVTDTLVQSGYAKAISVSGDLVMPQVSLRKKRYGINHVWDVHWKLSNRPAFADALTYEELVQTASEVCIDNKRVLIPNTASSLLIACLHLVGHHTNDVRLIWLYDIHLLVDSLLDEQKSQFLDKTTVRPEVQAACHAALTLTQQYMPSQRLDALQQALDPGFATSGSWDHLHISRMLNDIRNVPRKDRSRFIKQHIFPPVGYMLQRFHIKHRWRLPFWYALRIVRAIPKLFRRR